MTRCACPQSDPVACYRFRHNIDLRELVDGCEIDDDGTCPCVCHDCSLDDDDDDVDCCPECSEYWGHCECERDLDSTEAGVRRG